MSKSLGNFVTVHELLTEWPGEAIRLALLSGHYREPLDFSRERLAQAKQTLDRFYLGLREIANLGRQLPAGDAGAALEALGDDMNTPLAIARMHEHLRDLNVNLQEGRHEEAMPHAASLVAAGNLLGLLQQGPETWLKGDQSDLTIEDAVARRNAARKSHDFAEADRIRAELMEKGVILEDKPGGKTEWRRER
jgi:cysteinyl-tRNA synthetase